MTVYRFRVKFDSDPTSLWRDIVVGERRTLDELQSVINKAFGLDEGHLWFFGDDGYWNSGVKYECPEEYGDLPEMGGGILGHAEETYNADEETVGDMVRHLELEKQDRICYLYDYGDEWRFYAILKKRLEGGPDDFEPEVIGEKGDEIDQYGYRT